jgi:CRISPR-associated protein Cst2
LYPGVLQALPNTSIKDYEEIDLFGYMKTDVAVGKKKDNKDGEETLIRSAVARITSAISLEPFYNDVEFLNSKWMADRSGNQPNIANIEQHRSLYKYTVTIDLDRVGTENWNESIKNLQPVLKNDAWEKIKTDYLQDIEPKDKAQRITEFLEVIKNLYRDIRGRREDLKPLFIIGGVYPVKNPFFMNAVKIEWENGKPNILKEAIDEVLTSNYCYKDNGELKEEQVQTNTVIGLRNGLFANGTNFNGSHSPETAIDTLKNKVNEFYGV